MTIRELIKSIKELDELPFIVVFSTIQILLEKGLMKDFGDVDRV